MKTGKIDTLTPFTFVRESKPPIQVFFGGEQVGVIRLNGDKTSTEVLFIPDEEMARDLVYTIKDLEDLLAQMKAFK